MVVPEKSRIAPKSSVLNHPWMGVALLSLCYWGLTLYMATKRILWLDEFFTLHSVTQPTFGAVWNFMLTRGDQMPPYLMLLIHACVALFGSADWVLRIPAMLGFWVAMLCVYRITSRYSSPMFGLVAIAFMMATPIYYYASEARGYGPLLGCSGLALLCWLELDEFPSRRFALAGLAISLFLAPCCHYYGMLVPVPLALGELVRTAERRRIRWSVWLVFCAVLLPFPAVVGALSAARKGMTTFWVKPQIYHAVTWFDILLSGGEVVALVLALPLAQLRNRQVSPATSPAPRTMEKPVLVALLGFVALPLICVLLGVLVTGAYWHRYAVSALIGLAVFYGLGTSRLSRQDNLIALCLIPLLLLFAADYTKRQVDMSKEGREAVAEYTEMFRNAGLGQTPVLFGNVENWMRVQRYSQGPAQKAAIYAINDNPVGDQIPMVWLLHRFVPALPPGVPDFANIRSRPGRYGVYLETAKPEKWLIPALVKDHWNLQVLDERHAAILFLGTYPRLSTSIAGQ